MSLVENNARNFTSSKSRMITWALRHKNSLKIIGKVLEINKYGLDAVVTLNLGEGIIKIHIPFYYKYKNQISMQVGKRYFIESHVSKEHQDEEILIHSNYFFEVTPDVEDLNSLDITGYAESNEDGRLIVCRHAITRFREKPNEPTRGDYFATVSYYKHVSIRVDDNSSNDGDSIHILGASIKTDKNGMIVGINGKVVTIRESKRDANE